MNLFRPFLKILLILLTQVLYGQQTEPWQITLSKGRLAGTLLLADSTQKTPVVLLIPGSGPTDRNGNSISHKNNALKLLADSLKQHHISSLRIDKRMVGQSRFKDLTEKDLTFDRYVQDVILWLQKLKNDKRFSKIIVAGHSQGALTGLLAAQKIPVAAYISISGAGRPINEVLKQQLQGLVPQVKQKAYQIIDSLSQGYTVPHISGPLFMLFRPSVQKFLSTWMKYDPAIELSKLSIPILIVHGTTDLQIPVKDAKRLKKMNPKAKLVIIKDMNHVLKKAGADRQENLKTYHQPHRALHRELTPVLVDFIKHLK